MSGIIGGAGSKSGVIGTTELEYEEGEWTPSPIRPQNPNGGQITTDGSLTLKGNYTRIGNICYLRGQITITGSITQGSSNWQIVGLPFAILSDINRRREHMFTYNVGTTALSVNTLFGIHADYVYTALTDATESGWSAGGLYFNGSYIIA